MKAVMILTVMSAVAMVVWMPDPAHTTNRSTEGLGDVVAELMREMISVKNRLQAAETDFKTTKAKQASTITDLATQVTAVNGSRALNQGVAGGKNYNEKGSGTNPLCLTRTPQFDNTAKPQAHGYLYGAEYQRIPGHLDHDVPCSVCLAPQSTTIMVPATLTCPPGWTPHYTGHLVSQHKDYYATEYVCLDGSPEDDSSGVGNDNGLLFYHVMTVCGSLPCPPYINDKVVTCVICSK